MLQWDNMLAILLSVVVISFSGVMLPGPMFAVALAKSYKSPWTGAQMSLGHAVIEIPLVLLIYFGFARFFESTLVRFGLSIAGGAMIIWLGITLFRVRTKVAQTNRDLPYNAFVAGILLSLLNPLFILWWATIGSMLLMKFLDYSSRGLSLFIAVHWLCDLAWLSLVSVVGYKTRKLWGKRMQEGILTACSLVLMGFGGWFVVSGVRLLS